MFWDISENQALILNENSFKMYLCNHDIEFSIQKILSFYCLNFLIMKYIIPPQECVHIYVLLKRITKE